MLNSNVKISFTALAALLLAILACAPALGAPVAGVVVMVRNFEGNYVGENLIDGDISTAWVGGGSGVGPGKWIEFTFPAEVRLESIKVANGHQGKGRFDTFRRMTRGVILYPDNTRQKFTLKPGPGMQTLRLEPKTVRTFRVIITGVAPAAGDEAMGKAKVAVSEMTVHGEVTGSAGAGDSGDGSADLPVESVVKTKAVVKPNPVRNPKPIEKPKPVEKATPAVKPEQASRPGKSQVKKTGQALTPKKDAPEKAVSEKAASKPKPKKAAVRPKKAAVASKGATYLRTASEIPADKPLDMGVLSPWLDLELVAGIKRYFSHLTTLSDSYPEVFASSIRERERKAFLVLQETVRKKKEFGDHHIAMLELIGLNFDKPKETGNGILIRVHGPCRYYIGNRGFEFLVDTLFTLVREDGVWLISSVRDK